MRSVPVVIISRDRLAPLRQLLAWLEVAGHRRIHIIDNDSAYPPLLTYFDRLPRWVSVHKLGENLGSHAPWRTGFTREQFPSEPYIVTDPDIVPCETCPTDLADYLVDVLTAYPACAKVGVGLRIDDIPDCYDAASDVRAFEHIYWQNEIAPGLFHAPVDTTFAAYPAGSHEFSLQPAIRTGTPYLARHLGWYLDSGNLTAEEIFYASRANPTWATWNANFERSKLLRELLHIRATDGRGIRSKLYMTTGWVRAHRYYPRAFWEWQVLRRLRRRG